MPLLQVLKKTSLIYVCALSFIGVGWYSLFKRPLSQLNFLCSFFSGFGALYLASVAPVTNRDLTLCTTLFHIFISGSFIGAGGLITLVHFSLIFPRKKFLIKSYPRIVCVLYLYFFITVSLYLSGLCAFGAFFPFFTIWVLIMMFSFFHSWIKEKDPLLKKQISISLITPVACSFVFVFINLLPTFLGLPPLDFNYFSLISLILPITLFHVIENYHLYIEKIKSEQESKVERQNIIDELHDNIGNDLTNIKMFSEVIDKFLIDDINKVKKYISYIKETSKNSMEQLRDFLTTFDTKHVTWNDLISHFKEYGSTILQSKEIELDFKYSINGNVLLPKSTLKFNTYRIYKEALGNIIKHSETKNVEINIAICKKEIKMEIKDDGIGFDIESKSNNGHYGINNMKKRVKTMKGIFHLSSKDNKGTILKVIIPIG